MAWACCVRQPCVMLAGCRVGPDYVRPRTVRAGDLAAVRLGRAWRPEPADPQDPGVLVDHAGRSDVVRPDRAGRGGQSGPRNRPVADSRGAGPAAGSPRAACSRRSTRGLPPRRAGPTGETDRTRAARCTRRASTRVGNWISSAGFAARSRRRRPIWTPVEESLRDVLVSLLAETALNYVEVRHVPGADCGGRREPQDAGRDLPIGPVAAGSGAGRRAGRTAGPVQPGEHASGNPHPSHRPAGSDESHRRAAGPGAGRSR